MPEQRQLYDYWQEKAGANVMPGRSDISPAQIPRLLPNVSLLEREMPTDRFKIRLAGTCLREVFQREVTGSYVDHPDLASAENYWTAVCAQVLESASPAQGVVKAPNRANDHLVQFWLRLPLGADHINVDMILGLDMFVPAVEMAELQTICA